MAPGSFPNSPQQAGPAFPPDFHHVEGAARHPLRLKPSGNAFTSDQDLRDSMGFFRRLPEEILMQLLEWLDSGSLSCVSSSCRAFYAYGTNDQLWRDLIIRESPSGFLWRGSWRASCLQLLNPHPCRIDCQHLFSDALHRPFLCAQINISPFTSSIPAENEIPRLSDLSPSTFAEAWVGKPFILTEPVQKWPLFDKWCQESLLEMYSDTVFRAEAVNWPLRTYIDYMNSNDDESPLYLFDREFVEKMELQVGHNGAYWPPECFGEDLFMLLGEQRPDHRWLIVGPARSGSTFHKDPNATSAWNAVIRGSKYWIMFPSSVLPPGVFMSEDQSEVTSPLSIAEWLLTFHEEARKTPGCLEGICSEGEVLHVPSGWWHLVVNLDAAIAITQNFVPESHARVAIHFLRHKSAQVSGFLDDVKDPHRLFMDRLQALRPELLDSLYQVDSKKRKWADIVSDKDETCRGAEGFGFGFGSDVDEEDVR